MSTKIEWTDETWNPTVGCSKVSPGCDHCYAIGVAAREMQPAHKGLTADGDWTGEVRRLPDRLEQPLGWRKPRRVFVDSMSDLFHPAVPDDYIADVFAVMGAAAEHTFQVLTKRPQRMAHLLAHEEFGELVESKMSAHTHATIEPPLPNVWLGVSVENQRYADLRIPHLVVAPAAVRFLSCEPLLGPVDLSAWLAPGTCRPTRWHLSWRADPRGAALADRHYNRQSPGHPQFVPPGKCLVLLTEDAGALWVTSFPAAEYVQHEWAGAWVNSLFRREMGPLASELILEAVAATRAQLGEPPPLGMVTFIDESEIKAKRDPGYCYLQAGFEVVGRTKGGLLALQLLPAKMPAPRPPLDTQPSLDEAVRQLAAIRWVVVGGESGPGARPMHPDWARAIRDQCQAAGVPFFFKQWGEWAPAGYQDATHLLNASSGEAVERASASRRVPVGSHGWREEDLVDRGHPGWERIRRVGKKLAGRTLGDRTWDEMPEPTS